MPLMTFQEALEESGDAKRNLLLGNGFSIACRPDIFHYGSLFSRADFSAMPEARQLFDELGIQDFEEVIRALESSTRVLGVYQPENSELRAKLRAHSSELKDLLVQTLTQSHPDNVGSIDDAEYMSAARFLRNFLNDQYDGRVYTLNYDLLLYWTLMNAKDQDEWGIQEKFVNDGFGNNEDSPDDELVTWHADDSHYQRIFYVHGGLHLLDAGSQLKKYTWNRTGVALMTQIRGALEENMFPVFVAEGASRQKEAKIRHQAYLHHCLKSFKGIADQPGKNLFIFGHSLAENDTHLLRRIGKGKNPNVFISLFGDPNSETNQAIKARAEQLAQLRSNRYPMNIHYYSAESAQVWSSEAGE